MNIKSKIFVKSQRMKNLQQTLGLNDTAMAKRIGISRQTYLRALDGESVSAEFAAGAVVAFGGKFEALFEARIPASAVA